MRVRSYVITTDRGSAPNYKGPAVTLTICKPRIRKTAQQGDLVLAFNGRTLAPNPHSLHTVRWAGIVSEVLPIEKYWDDPRFRAKRPGPHSETPDNIYRLVDGHFSQVENKSHGEGHVATDIRGKNALIFSHVWHMGDNRPELPEIFDLRVVANRRLEPLREISSQQWIELEGWLKTHDCRLPMHRNGSRCSPCVALQSKGAKC